MMEKLLDCLISSDLKRLKILLKKIGINGRVPGTDGFTPLHVVAGIDALNDKESIMSYLLENGADPNARSDENLTPVHIAAMWDRCFQLEVLLKHGGNPWLLDDERKNCFDVAIDNQSYEAFQLLNIYLHENKLNVEPGEKESRKLTFATPDTFSTPMRFKNSEDDALNNTLNLTYLTAKESKFSTPVISSTPGFTEEPKNETFNESMNFTFMSAKENFPLIFSSNDESEDYASDASDFLEKIKKHKQGQDPDAIKNGMCESEIDKCANKVSTIVLNDDTVDKCANKVSTIVLDDDTVPEIEKNQSKEKDLGNYLDKAYIFSSSSDSSDTATSDLSESDGSCYGTIIDCSDTSGIILIETKNEEDCLHSSNSSICSVPNDWKSYHNVVSDCSTLSYCSSHSKSTLIVPDDVQKYSNSKIFLELKNMGDNPGPVLDHTRHVYLHRLARLISGCATTCVLPKPKYCPEIYLFLENKLDMDRAQYLEQNIEEEFDAETSKDWREGKQRCCFNYFLLDPRVTQNLPQRAKKLTAEQIFLTFLDALFYVGKGTRGRPYSHLFEAAKALEDNRSKSEKVNHILDIWDAGLGVISLHCFHNSIPVEAYTREACIIEAVGLGNLTNVKKGDFYGLCAKLTSSRKRLIGISLLHKALQIFLLEGERIIKPKDIRKL